MMIDALGDTDWQLIDNELFSHKPQPKGKTTKDGLCNTSNSRCSPYTKIWLYVHFVHANWGNIMCLHVYYTCIGRGVIM